MQARNYHRSDKRKHPRLPGNRAVVRASWLDTAGTLKLGQARLIDISEGGVALELPEPPQASSLIRFQCDRFRLYGMGSIRYVSGTRGRCVVGLQFAAGSGWLPAQSAAFPLQNIDQDWNWNFAETSLV
jgi:hypothetical protein